jgi:hypothetical protein
MADHFRTRRPDPQVEETGGPGIPMLNLFPREDTYSYRGWLVSDHFWKRAFGIFGYGFAAEMVIVLAMLLVLAVLELALRLIPP